jgi:hypothetical protein
MLVPFSHHRRRTGQLIPAAISAQQTSTLICPWALATPCSTITITTLVTSHLIWDLIRTTLETRPTGLNRTRQNENEMIFYFEKAEIKSNLYRYCISIISLSFYVCVPPHLPSHLWCLYFFPCWWVYFGQMKTFCGARYLHSSMANEVRHFSTSSFVTCNFTLWRFVSYVCVCIYIVKWQRPFWLWNST